MHEFSVPVRFLFLCPYFFTSVERGLVTVLCMQCLTLLAQEAYSTSHALNSKMFSRLYYNLSNCFMFVNTVLIRIYITLGTIVKRYKDQLHDTMNQLHENISTRQLVLICRAYTMLTWQFTWIPEYCYSLGNVM